MKTKSKSKSNTKSKKSEKISPKKASKSKKSKLSKEKKESHDVMASGYKKHSPKKAVPFMQNPARLHFKNIEGWFDYSELYKEVVSKAEDGDEFVEVGVWKGKSAAFMGEMIKRADQNGEKKLHYYGVDFFEITLPRHEAFMPKGTSFLEEAEENINLQDVEEYVTLIKMPSLKAVDLFEKEQLFFVFIDGDHDSPAVDEDLEKWFPKVKKGGIFAGHDYTSEELHGDVRKAVDKFASKHDLKVEIKGSSWVIYK